MRSYLTLVLAMIIAGTPVNAQSGADSIRLSMPDSIRLSMPDTIGLSMPIFKKVLNQQFTNLITGQSKNSIGSFASLDSKDAEVSFSGSSIFADGSVFAVKASGGASDGLFSIFTNSKLNTKIAVDVQYNFLALSKRSLTYYNDSFKNFESKVKQIRYDFSMDSLSIKLHQPKTLLILTKVNLEALKARLAALIAAETTVTARRDSLQYQLARVSFQIDSVTTAINKYPSMDDQLLEDLANNRAKELKKLKPDIELYGFRFGWFSIGYKVQSNSFKLFHSSAAYDSQIVKSSFVSHEARLQYSFYRWSLGSYESYFWCAGMAFSNGDNLSELTTTEISEVKNYGANPNDRTTTKKYNAYSGDYKQDIKGFRLYGDYYRFLFDQNMAAVHAYPELQIRHKEKPQWNIGFGFLLSFKDVKDESSVVNAELYYNFLDVSGVTDTTLGLFERNRIGIRFSFPIKFKTQ